MGNGVIPLMVVAMVPIIAGGIGQRALSKRNAPTNLDYPDYSAKYDEYPVSNSMYICIDVRPLLHRREERNRRNRGKSKWEAIVQDNHD